MKPPVPQRSQVSHVSSCPFNLSRCWGSTFSSNPYLLLIITLSFQNLLRAKASEESVFTSPKVKNRLKSTPPTPSRGDVPGGYVGHLGQLVPPRNGRGPTRRHRQTHSGPSPLSPRTHVRTLFLPIQQNHPGGLTLPRYRDAHTWLDFRQTVALRVGKGAAAVTLTHVGTEFWRVKPGEEVLLTIQRRIRSGPGRKWRCSTP